MLISDLLPSRLSTRRVTCNKYWVWFVAILFLHIERVDRRWRWQVAGSRFVVRGLSQRRISVTIKGWRYVVNSLQSVKTTTVITCFYYVETSDLSFGVRNEMISKRCKVSWACRTWCYVWQCNHFSPIIVNFVNTYIVCSWKVCYIWNMPSYKSVCDWLRNFADTSCQAHAGRVHLGLLLLSFASCVLPQCALFGNQVAIAKYCTCSESEWLSCMRLKYCSYNVTAASVHLDGLQTAASDDDMGGVCPTITPLSSRTVYWTCMGCRVAFTSQPALITFAWSASRCKFLIVLPDVTSSLPPPPPHASTLS